MPENVRVIVRCRPMNKREHTNKCQNIIKIDGCTLEVENPTDRNAPSKLFTFDGVYGPVDATESMYQDICYNLVENVLEGYNGTIFAYGQTGCGKTYTMQGAAVDGLRLTTNYDIDRKIYGDIPQGGIIMRSFDHIFEAIAVTNNCRYLAIVSYLEIYNENIRDLLNPNANVNHHLKELPTMGGVSVPTLSTFTVQNAIECYKLLYTGNNNRMVGATLMNMTSSRSHTIFTIQLEQITRDGRSNVDADDSDGNDGTDTGGINNNTKKAVIRSGKLNLVDLAGSERQNKTGAAGDRLKEATKINLSLSALGNVISALVDGKTKYIPYRDSKLTRILQDSLGGNTKTLMIACISPAEENYDETISTLRYAARAKKIANKPIINEDPKDAMLRQYQEEIEKLKMKLSLTMTATTPLTINNHDYHSAGNMKSNDVFVKDLDQDENANEENQHQQIILYNNEHQQVVRQTDCDQGEDRDRDRENSLQLEVQKRIEMIKRALIGGERANDLELRERRHKKKLEAQKRLSTLAYLLSRVQQNEDRDLLQDHYTNIQQEVNAKNECLKRYRTRTRAMECELADIQAEFQLDRSDYLETIRRQERNLKFYRQLLDQALPILRKDGKYWDPESILLNSVWNDDTKNWKLPSGSMNSLRLPVTPLIGHTQSIKSDNNEKIDQTDEKLLDQQYMDISYKRDVLKNYFRTTRPKWNYNVDGNSATMPRTELKTLKSINM